MSLLVLFFLDAIIASAISSFTVLPTHLGGYDIPGICIGDGVNKHKYGFATVWRQTLDIVHGTAIVHIRFYEGFNYTPQSFDMLRLD